MPFKSKITALPLIVILFFSHSLPIGVLANATKFSSPHALVDKHDPSPEADILVIRVFFTDFASLNRLARYLDIWEVNYAEGYLVAMAPRSTYTALLQAGFRVDIDLALTARLVEKNHPLPGQVSGIPGFPCYRTVEETYADLAQIAQDHPTLAQWIDIGDSWEKIMPGSPAGYDIYSLVLTSASTTLSTGASTGLSTGASTGLSTGASCHINL